MSSFQASLCSCAYQDVKSTNGRRMVMAAAEQAQKNNEKSLTFTNETFEGAGQLDCFGQMSVTLQDRGGEEGEGTAECRPIFEDPDQGITIAPQGFIADGEDGSHWVRNYP